MLMYALHMQTYMPYMVALYAYQVPETTPPPARSTIMYTLHPFIEAYIHL